MRRSNKAFSLLELLIVMAVMSIIMAAAAPGVDKWVARYRTRSFVSTFVSDLAEARILATTAGNYRSSTSATTSAPLQAAIRFTETEYQILTRSSAPLVNDWNPSQTYNTLVKTVRYPRGVTIENVAYTRIDNNVLNYTLTGGTPRTFVFLSTGSAMDATDNQLLKASLTEICGSGNVMPPATLRINVKSEQKLSEPVYYRILLDPNGGYSVCYAPSTNFPSQGQIMNSF